MSKVDDAILNLKKVVSESRDKDFFTVNRMAREIEELKKENKNLKSELETFFKQQDLPEIHGGLPIENLMVGDSEVPEDYIQIQSLMSGKSIYWLMHGGNKICELQDGVHLYYNGSLCIFESGYGDSYTITPRVYPT